MKEVTRVIIVNYEKKVLLGKRARGCGKGQWALVGGKPEGCESMKECAIREVMEELGIKVEPRLIKELVDEKSVDEPWKILLYEAYFNGELSDVKIEVEEIEEVGFFSKSDFEDINIAYNHKELLEEYFRI